MNTKRRPKVTALLASGAACLLLAGCAAGTAPAESSPSAHATVNSKLEITGAWAKAAEAGKATGLFAEIRSIKGGATVVGVESAAAAMAQLHTMVADAEGGMTMQEVKELKVPAGRTLKLEPGKDHIMLMELHHVLKPGDTVPVTLRLADGSAVKFDAIAKEYSAGQESYAPQSTTEPMAEHTSPW